MSKERLDHRSKTNREGAENKQTADREGTRNVKSKEQRAYEHDINMPFFFSLRGVVVKIHSYPSTPLNHSLHALNLIPYIAEVEAALFHKAFNAAGSANNNFHAGSKLAQLVFGADPANEQRVPQDKWRSARSSCTGAGRGSRCCREVFLKQPQLVARLLGQLARGLNDNGVRAAGSYVCRCRGWLGFKGVCVCVWRDIRTGKEEGKRTVGKEGGGGEDDR